MAERLSELTERWVAEEGSREWFPLSDTEMHEFCELQRLEIERLLDEVEHQKLLRRRHGLPVLGTVGEGGTITWTGEKP